MMIHEQSRSIRNAMMAAAEERLAAAHCQAAVIETVRETARNACTCDGITFVLREGEQCHYVEEDAIGPMWQGQKFPPGACISG